MAHTKKQTKTTVSIREQIFHVIEPLRRPTKTSAAYDYLMIVTILVSFVPLMFKTDSLSFQIIDKICVTVFIADYLLRLWTADFNYRKKSAWSFLRYPFSPMAIIDLLSILPSLTIFNSSFKLLRVTRIAKTARVLRVLKLLRYSRSVKLIMNVLKKSKKPLTVVGILALIYILMAALVLFNFEPEQFDSFLDAIYATVVTREIEPLSYMGKLITMFSSIFGVAIVALPAGIVTAEYISELRQQQLEAEERALEREKLNRK